MQLFKFGADGSEYSKGLDKMRKDTKAWAGNIKGMIGGALGVTGVVMGFQKITEAAKELNKQAKLFDVSTTTIQKFGAAAEQAGFNFDNLADAMHDMTEKAQDAANGNQNYADAFTMMGMKAEDFMNLPFEEKVKAFGDGLKYAGDQGLEFLAANELAGGAAQELIGTFKDGGDAFFEYADGINTVSEANIKAALKAAEAWREVKNEMVSWSNELATGFREAMPWMKALWKTVSVKIGGGLARAQMATNHKGTWEELKKKNEMLNADLAAAEEMINDELNENLEKNKEKDAKDPEKEAAKSGKKSPTAAQEASLSKIARLEKDIATAKDKAKRDQLDLLDEEIMLQNKLAKLQKQYAKDQAAYLDTYSGDNNELSLKEKALQSEKDVLAVKRDLESVSAEKKKVDAESDAKQKSLIEDDQEAKTSAKIEALEAMKIDSKDNLITTSLQGIGGGGGFSMLGDPQLDETKKTNTKLDELIANTKPAGGTKDVEV